MVCSIVNILIMGTNYCVLLVRRLGSSKVLFDNITESNARMLCDHLRHIDKRSKFQYSFEKSKNNGKK